MFLARCVIKRSLWRHFSLRFFSRNEQVVSSSWEEKSFVGKHEQPGRMPVLEEARTMDYVTNHNMITMAMNIFKTLNMAAECGGM